MEGIKKSGGVDVMVDIIRVSLRSKKDRLNIDIY